MADEGTRPERRAVRRGFERIAAGYAQASFLDREIARRMGERLDYVKLAPRRILDLGCGPGADTAALASRYPQARLVGCDLSFAMLAGQRDRRPWIRRVLARGEHRQLVCADAERLPLAGGTVSLVWSNLLGHWLADPLPMFREVLRVMEVGGLYMFSMLGPDTLRELRRAFAAADAHPHVHGFIDMHDVGDMLVAAGFAEPVMDMETLALTYPGMGEALRELRAAGPRNAAAGRHRGLTGKRAWQRMLDAYEAMRRDARLPASIEVVYGHAWKQAPRVTEDGRAIVRLDLPRRRPR